MVNWNGRTLRMSEVYGGTEQGEPQLSTLDIWSDPGPPLHT